MPANFFDEIGRYLRPPPMPEIDFPVGSHAAGLINSVSAAFEFAYWQGVKDVGLFAYSAGALSVLVIEAGVAFGVAIVLLTAMAIRARGTHAGQT